MEFHSRFVELISFDAGFTLLEPHPPVGEMYAGIAARFGFSLVAGDVQQRFERVWLQETGAGRLEGKNHPLAANESARRWWKNVFAASVGISDEDPLLAPMFETCFAEYGRGNWWRVYPDVFPALERLRIRGTPAVLLSNWDSRLRRTLDETGLTPFFQRVFISAEVGLAKPDPDIFLLMAREMGVPADRILHIGDSLHEDALAAQAAGINALLLDRRSKYDLTPPGVQRLGDLHGLFPH